MKRTILFLFFVLAFSVAFAQKIHFCDTSNRWTGRFIDLSGWPTIISEPYSAQIDTGTILLDGKSYHPVEYTGSLGLATYRSGWLVREDTVLSKVFKRIHPAWGGPDTIETVLFDYNWRVGDTVKRTSYFGDSFVHYVSSIDSITLNAVWYKVWHFEPLSTMTDHYDVIEGIGCARDPIFPVDPLVFEWYSFLYCFSHAGSYPLMSSSVFSLNNSSCALGIEATQVENTIVSVVPNPINETSKIIFPGKINSGNVTIINSVGKTVMSTTIQNKVELLIGDKITSPGIYLYRVTDNETGNSYSGKFVRQ